MTNLASAPIRIDQNPEGYRYSVEPFLLADWARPTAGSQVLDIGTGCGIIPLLLRSRQANLKITAVELQGSLARKAKENAVANGWSDDIRVLEGNFTALAKQWPAATFDWILSNPPYRKVNSGKLNPCREKALARHELALTLADLVQTSVRLLKPGGKIALAYPFHRLAEVMAQLRRNQLHPTRLVRVSGQAKGTPKICLVEAVRGDGPATPREESFILYHPDGYHTKPMQDIYASFNHPERSDRLG